MRVKGIKRKLTYIILSMITAVCICGTALIAHNATKASALSAGTQIELYTEDGEWSRTGYNQLATKFKDMFHLSSQDGDTDFDADDLAIVAKNGTALGGATAIPANQLMGQAVTNAEKENEWSVLIGGIEWMPVYLSYSQGDDTNPSSGDLVLTLWQAESTQNVPFNLGYTQNREVVPYSNNYSTSYVRTAVLNNSGTYYTNYSSNAQEEVTLTPVTYEATEEHRYALFTMGEVSNYLLTPSQVKWQATESEKINDLSETESGYSEISANNYTAWGNDKVWLASTGEAVTLWGTTLNQRRNSYDNWLRSANFTDMNVGEDYNQALSMAYRMYNSGTVTAQYFVDYEFGVRPCIHLNLSRSAKLVEETRGYLETNTSDTDFALFQTAWQAAIDNNATTSFDNETSSDTNIRNSASVAHVYYDSAKGMMVFQLRKDWGAKNSIFGGSLSTTTNYYYKGALSILEGKSIYLDLNGHDINRNLLNQPAVNWGFVIHNAGVLTIDDSTYLPEYVKVDETGVKGCGWICGGNNNKESSLPDNGGGIHAQGNALTTVIKGGICFNRCKIRGGAICSYLTSTGLTAVKGGVLAHNIAGNYGGALYCGAQSKDFVATTTVDGVEIAYNYSGNTATFHCLDSTNSKFVVGKDTTKTVKMHHNEGQRGALFHNDYGTSRDTRGVYEIYSGEFYENLGNSGGVVDLDNYGEIYFYGGHFYNNRSRTKGGVVSLNNNNILYVGEGAVFENNSAETDAGGIYMGNGATCNLRGGEFKNNTCKGNGGGIYIADGVLDMSAGLFEGNSCYGDGGGIYMAGGTATMSGGEFKDNICTGNGGGLYIGSSTASITMSGGQFTNNTAAKAYNTTYNYTNTGVEPAESGTVESRYPLVNTSTMTYTKTDTKTLIEDSGYGGGIYMTAGTFNMTNGTFNRNIAEKAGGAVYMTNGTFTLDASGTNKKVNIINNISDDYPGFYCPTVYFAGELNIRYNQTPSKVEQNVYLVNKTDSNTHETTERAVVYVTKHITGYIGVTKDVPTNGAAWVAVGSGYEMTVEDLLCLHCDASGDYLFTVAKDYDDVADPEHKGNRLSYIALSASNKHIHSWQTTEISPTCTEQGYFVWVCTGCQEILEIGNQDHIGAGKYSTETSKPGFNPNTMTSSVSYEAPTGHDFVWVEDGYFDCLKCHEKLYFEFDEISSKPFNNEQQRVGIDEIEWRLYSLFEDEYTDEVTKVVQAYSWVNASDVSVDYNGVDAKNAVTVQAPVVLKGIKQAISGKYIVPFGSAAGSETSDIYNYDNKVTSTASMGPKISYEITKVSPQVLIDLPAATTGSWYVADSETFFSRVEYNVSINGGTVIVDATGMSNTLGSFTWKNKATGSDYPALVLGESTYGWTWTPNNDNLGNIESDEGIITVTAKDYGLHHIEAIKKDNLAIYDNLTNAQLIDLFNITAYYERDQLGTNMLEETLTSETDTLRVIMVATNGREFTSLREGSFKFRFSYTYNGVRKEYLTTTTYNVLPQPMDSITATLKNANAKIYDSMQDIEDLRDYIKVDGVRTRLVDGVETTEQHPNITSFLMSCADWGSGQKTYTVTVTYGTCEDTVEVPVIANKVTAISVVWDQNLQADTSMLAKDVPQLGTLTVTAHYSDGSSREINQSVDNQEGYEILGEISKADAYNTLTVKYTEASKYSLGVTSTAQSNISVMATDVVVRSVKYEMRENCVIEISDANTPYSNLANKIKVLAMYQRSPEFQEVPYRDNKGDAKVYYDFGFVSYNPEERLFKFQVRITNGSKTYRSTSFSLDPTLNVIEDIRVENTENIPTTITNMVTLDFYVANYVKVTEIWTNSEVVVYDPYNNKLDGASRVTATLPSNQEGAFKVGTNVITIRYQTEEGTTYTKTIEQEIVKVVIESISVSIKPAYVDGSDATMIARGNVFTSSSAEAIKNYIVVNGTNTENRTSEISAYTVVGSCAESGKQAFVVKLSQADKEDLTRTVYAYVTPVEIVSISAVLNQGDTLVYTNTQASTLTGIVKVTATNNDGSKVAINSGYEVEIDGKEAFTLNDECHLKVTYGDFSAVTAGAVTVSDKHFSGIGITSRQNTNMVYASASAQTIADNIIVRALYSDGTSEVISYKGSGESGYEISGSFEDEEGVYVEYDGEREKVTVLNVTALVIVGLEIDSTDVPTPYYVVLGLNNLKNYLVVTAIWNDGIRRPVAEEDYTLSSNKEWDSDTWTEQAKADGYCNYTVKVTVGSRTKNYTQVVHMGRINGIVSVVSTQGNQTIYASNDVNDYAKYLSVTVSKTDKTQENAPDGLNQNEFYLVGEANYFGYYKLAVRIHGVTLEGYDTEYSSDDYAPILNITARAARELKIEGEQGDTKILAGSPITAVNEIYSVSVVFNAQDEEGNYIEQELTYSATSTAANDTYQLSGSLGAFGEPEYQTVYFSYTYNNAYKDTHVTTVATKQVLVTPEAIVGVSASISNQTTIYASKVYEGGVFKPSKLGGYVSSALTVNNVYNTGKETATYDYIFIDHRYEEGKDAAYVIGHGGKVIVAVTTAQFEDEYAAAKAAYNSVMADEEASAEAKATAAAEFAAFKAAKAPEVEIVITAVVPTGLTVTQSGTIYASANTEKIKAGLTVKETYNDGSEREIESGYELNIESGIVAINSSVTISIEYYDAEADALLESGLKVINITAVEAIANTLKATFKGTPTIYATSSDSTVRESIRVEIKYNDAPETYVEVDSDAYSIDAYELPASGNKTLTITYSGQSTSCAITVTAITLESISIEKAAGEEVTVELYTSNTLEDAKDKITVKATGTNDTDMGVVADSDYELSLYASDGVTPAEWGAGNYKVKVEYSGKTTMFNLTVTAYALKASDSEVRVASDLTLYTDYVLSEEIERIESKLIMSATWNDGIYHGAEYTFEVISVSGIEGTKESISVTYSYTNNRNGEGIVNATQEVSLTLTAAVVEGVAIEAHDGYELYTSDDVIEITEESDLYLVYNSGKRVKAEWSDYSYTVSAPGWSAGGAVAVTVNVTVSGTAYRVTRTFNVAAVVLDRIEITSYATEDKDYITQSGTIYATSGGTAVMSAITLSVNAIKNDGSVETGVSVGASQLIYDFSESNEVEVRYESEGVVKSARFLVVLTAIELTKIEVSLIDATTPIYTNTDINTVAGYIEVTATYNDGNSKEIKSGANGYVLSGDIQLTTSVKAQKEVGISYTENGVTKDTSITLWINPAKLESISVTYTQNGALYAYGGISKVISAPNVIIVFATYSTEGANGQKSQFMSQLSASQYTVTYNGDTELPDATGVYQLKVNYSYNGGSEEAEGTFEISLTAKAKTGIEVTYALKAGEKLYSTTDSTKFKSKLESVEIKESYNDGSPAIIISEPEYEVEVSYTNKLTVKFIYGGDEAIFEPAYSLPAISAIDVSINGNFKAYIGTGPTEIKNGLTVTGHYDDDGYTADTTLTSAQYNIAFNEYGEEGNKKTYDTNTIGKKELTVRYSDSVTKEISINVYQKVQISDVVIEYQKKSSGEQAFSDRKTLKGSTLVGGKEYIIYAYFIVQDDKVLSAVPTKKYLALRVLDDEDKEVSGAWKNVDNTVYTIEMNGLTAEDAEYYDAGNTDSKFILTGTNGLAAAKLTKDITLTKRTVVNVDMNYLPKSGETIYTTTSIDEIMRVKGTLEISDVFNDGETEVIENLVYGENYTIENFKGLSEGEVSLNVQYRGSTLIVKINVIAPQVVSYAANITGNIYYGYSVTDIKDNLEIIATYNDYAYDFVNKEYTSVARTVTGALSAAKVSEAEITINGEEFNGIRKPMTYSGVKVSIKGVKDCALADDQIIAIEIKKAIITAEAISIADQDYQNAQIRPELEIEIHGMKLSASDYEVTAYGANKEVSTGGSVTVAGIGENYTGEATKAFRILKVDNAWITQPTIRGWTYGDDQNAPEGAELKFGDESDIEYTISRNRSMSDVVLCDDDHQLGQGTYYMKAHLEGTSNYNGLDSEVVSFQVSSATMTLYAEYVSATENEPVISGEYVKELVYNGSEQVIDGRAFKVRNSAVQMNTVSWKMVITDITNDQRPAWGVITDDHVSVKNVSTQKVWYNIRMENYTTIEGWFTLKVNAAEIVIKANDTEVTYGEEVEDNGYAIVSGQLYGSDVLSGTAEYSSTYEAGVTGANASGVTISVSGLSNGNYAIGYEAGAVSVNKRPITIEVDDKVGDYGDDILPLTYSVTSGSVYGSDELVINLVATSFNGYTMGESEIVCTYDGSVYPNSNYEIEVANGGKGKYTVGKRGIDVVITTSGTSVYGEAIEISGSASNVLAGDSVAYEVKLTKGGDTYGTDEILNAGSYQISCVGVGNYEVRQVSYSTGDGEYVVSAKAAAVSWDDLDGHQSDLTISYTYMGQAIEISGHYVDITGEEKAIAVTEDSGKEIKKVGSYSVTASTTDGNYTLTNASKAVEISKATLVITIHDKIVSKGTPVQEVKYTCGTPGLGAEDEVEVSYSCAYSDTSEEGEIAIGYSGYTIKDKVSGADVSDQYTHSIVSGTLYVTASGSGSSGSASITLVSGQNLAYFSYLVDTVKNGAVTKSKMTKLNENSITETTHSSGKQIYLSLANTVKWSDLSAIFESGSEVTAKNYKGKALTSTSNVGTNAKITVNGIEIVVILRGDVDGDGKLTASDYADIKDHVKKTYTITETYVLAADSDGDGKITASDYVDVKDHVKGSYNIFTGV